MQKKMMTALILALFLITAFLAGCSSGKTTAAAETTSAVQQETAGETEQELQAEETGAPESASITDEEVLFDFYSIPADWPKSVPLHAEMKVTSYERTENSMLASGYCTYDMVGINNFYTNARKEVGGGFPWEWDQGKESITQGSDQVFYFVSEDGQSLTIKFAEAGESALKFELDYKQ